MRHGVITRQKRPCAERSELEPFGSPGHGEVLRDLARGYASDLQSNGGLIVRHGLWWRSHRLPPADVSADLAERRTGRQLTTGQWGWLFLLVALSMAVLSAVGWALSPEATVSLAAIGFYLLIGYVLCRRPCQIRRFQERHARAIPVADPWR